MQIERLGHSPISLVLTLAFLNFILRVLLFSQMTSLMTILEDYFNWKGNEETLSCNKYIPLSSQSRLTSMACISLFLLHQCFTNVAPIGANSSPYPSNCEISLPLSPSFLSG